MHKRTIFNYLANPDFRAALRAEQDKLLAATSARLAGGAELALKTFEDVMSDPDASQASRVRAGVAWLDARRKMLELDDLAERITQLEGKL